MKQMIEALEAATSRCVGWVMRLCMVCVAVFLTGQIAIVLLRYVMGVGFLELQDLVTYAFSVLVVMAVPLTYWHGRHVRVDVLSGRLGPRMNRRIERAAALVLVLPVFGLLLFDAWPLVAGSFGILEGSRETGGLGGLFLVKGAVIVMSALILLIALVSLVGGKVGDGG